MNLKRISGFAVFVAMGLLYGVVQQSDNKSNLSDNKRAISSKSIKVSSSGDYGNTTDSKPTDWLASSVLTSNIKDQLHSANIVYNHTGAFVIDDNKTNLNAGISSRPYVQLSTQDLKGRPQVANALLNKSSREYRNRQSTGNSKTIDPVGWHQLTVSKGKVLYNRGHSIGYALAGSIKGFDASEANQQNITTQTAWANQSSNGNVSNTGQNYYETLIRKALDSKAGIRIRYRVTPMYDGNNLVPSGTHLEAKSNDGSVQFNVFVPNVQPGVSIDYATGYGKIVR